MSYHQLTFSELTKRIAKTYKLDVISHATTQLIPEFTITAESALQSLIQLAKQQNLILQETQQGIEIFNPAQLKNNNIKLELGKNISQANITNNWSKSYYHYEVRGYPLDSDTPASKSIQLDTTIRQARGKAWLADKLTDDKACQNRAKYEMNMAAANSTTISLTVPQLHTALTGDAINKQIYFAAKQHDISDWHLTKSITLNVAATKSDTQVQLINLPVQEITS